MSIRMNPGMSRLTVLGKGWNDNTVIDSGDGFTVDEEIWGGDDELWDGGGFPGPGGGDVPNPDGGDTFRFTVRTNTSNRFAFRLQGEVTVDWGDGEIGNYWGYSLTEVRHDYAPSSTDGYSPSSTEYTVSIAGDLQNISFCRNEYPITDDGQVQQVTAVLTPFPVSMKAVETFDNLFRYCFQLTSLPRGLFKNCPNAKSFRYAFAGGIGVTSSIIYTYPMKLPELPEDLFSYCPLAEDFYGCFHMCSSLTSLPHGLFANLNKARSFAYCFQCCSGLSAIPGNLFSGCSSAEEFQYCFGGYGRDDEPSPHLYVIGCSVGNIPAGLFADCVNARNFQGCFYICFYLNTIPQGLFDSCTNAEDFSFCFGGYRCGNYIYDTIYPQITEIPAGLFANNHAVTTFASCFRYGEKITSALPALWATHAGANGKNCFSGCEKAENYESVPEEWGGPKQDERGTT